MSGRILEIGDVAAEEDLLFSNKPEMRLLGRMIATGWPKIAQAWCRAELERGTDAETLLKARYCFEVSFLGSVAGNLFRPSYHATARDNLKGIVDRMFVAAATDAGTLRSRGRAPWPAS